MIHRKLPQERVGLDKRAQVNGVRFHILTGEYEDGTLGEVMVRAGKAGDEIRLLCVAFTYLSMGLQAGIPLERFIENTRGTLIGEGGLTDDADNPLVKNILDYTMKFLESKYGGKE